MIRRATLADAVALGRIFCEARDRMTYLPRIPEDDRPKLGPWLVERHETWVAELNGRVVGFASLGSDFLDHLYVDPAAQNRGVGTALLDHSKRLRSRGLQLWTFQKNEGARRFYERRGFRLVRVTDGSENMEREPDALYAWTPERHAN